MVRILWTDSRQSAHAIMTNEGGSWRTRHLRLRAAHARMRVSSGDWSIRHIPGLRMVADLGTKALTSNRLRFLKEEMQMWFEETSDEPVCEKREPSSRPDAQSAVAALKMLTISAMLHLGESSSLDLSVGSDEAGEMFLSIGMVVITVLVMVGTCVSVGPHRTTDVGPHRNTDTRVPAPFAENEVIEISSDSSGPEIRSWW